MRLDSDTILDPKAMAQALRKALKARDIEITHSVALDIVAAQHGLADWNRLATRLRTTSDETPRFEETCPLMRIFDEAKAREFYLGFLGFRMDWEYRFGEGFPLYAQVSRAGLTLHLTEHHGDASPGCTAFVRMAGIEAYRQELLNREYPYERPDIETAQWGLAMEVTDPFYNRIRFCESKPIR
ncbi:glyoxalase superfamily protein [Methylobacterium sp. sgz302541]|uniref:glyoxalase superfamily protein n=1 Tax=unclassified Methylobacterium TaxID=2615210 RepID=UPI003D325FDE